MTQQSKSNLITGVWVAIFTGLFTSVVMIVINRNFANSDINNADIKNAIAMITTYSQDVAINKNSLKFIEEQTRKTSDQLERINTKLEILRDGYITRESFNSAVHEITKDHADHEQRIRKLEQQK